MSSIAENSTSTSVSSDSVPSEQPVSGTDSPAAAVPVTPSRPAETGGPKGLEPTRYEDWERGGRCIDF